MNRNIYAGAAALAAIVSAAAAQATTVIIPSTADIFLASQPGGTSISGFFGSDTAPGNSPVGFSVTAGDTITETATGTTSVDASCFAGADGGCYPDESFFSPGPASGTYKGPSDALIGVFLGPGVTSVANGPPSLDYTISANTGLVTQSPALNQIFFLGDGVTDTAALQQFVAPAGATRLFLAAADSYGSSTGNLGALTVNISGATPIAAPEPAGWALMMLGLGVVGAQLRRRLAPGVPVA